MSERVDPGVMKIEVDGVELTIKQTIRRRRTFVDVSRVIGRDRKVKVDVTRSCSEEVSDAYHLVELLKEVAAYPVMGCSCDYRYGFSDHAEHCRSFYVARDMISYDDD